MTVCENVLSTVLLQAFHNHVSGKLHSLV